MKESKALDILTKIIIGIFFAILAFGVSFYIYDTAKGKRPDKIQYRCEELTGWVWVHDGIETPTEFPFSELKVPKGEPVTLVTTLPGNIGGDMWLDYYSGKNTRFYIDGELRLDFNESDDDVPGGVVKSLHMYVPLYPEDSGKEIRIERYDPRENGGSLNRIYIGTGLGLVERILVYNVWHYVLILTLLIMAVLAIIIGSILRLSHRGDPHISSVGAGIFLVGMWLILDSELYQFAFRNYYIDGTMSFIASALMPYPFIYHINILQKRRYKALYAGAALYFEIVIVVLTFLNFTDRVDYLESYPVMAASQAALIWLAFVTLIIDFVRKFYKDYLLSFIGYLGFGAFGTVEILRIMTVVERIDGSSLVAGLYFLLFCTILHEVTVIREFERTRNMAIIASEAKTNFLANMSHEIRTPMNAILGMCELILRDSGDSRKVGKYATDIKSAGNLLLALINDILDISKVEAGKAVLLSVDFEICSVLNDILNITHTRASEKQIEFKFNVSEDIPYRFYGDELRIRQIILNVVNNAVKYTEEGSVSVDVSFAYSHAEGKDETGTLCVKVSDTGIGIREEDMKKLFTSFSRLEESRNRNIEGTGLGLNIAYTYITLMGGTIDVESLYGKGSVFTLNIPLKVTDPKRIGNFSDAVKGLGMNSYEYIPVIMAPGARILVVDDNEMNILVVKGLLENTKIRIDSAMSGQEAIKLYGENKYDLVMLDQMMPGLDGIATLQLIKEKYGANDVPFIALTADAISGAKDFYIGQGFTDYLSKPVKPEDLEKLLLNRLPKDLLMTREQIEEYEKDKAKENTPVKPEDLKTVLVIDPDVKRLKELREQLNGIFKTILVTDVNKATRYLENYSADIVMMDGKLYAPQKNENA